VVTPHPSFLWKGTIDVRVHQDVIRSSRLCQDGKIRHINVCMLRKLDGTAISTKRLYKDLIANRITSCRIGNPPESERGRPATKATTTDCPRSAGSSDRSVLAMQTMGTF